MPTVKLSTKNTTASLDDSTQMYQVTGSTKADKVLIYPEVNVSSMDLKAGNDAVHLPYDLSEYIAKINKTTLILTAFDDTIVKINIGANQTDTLYFADGFVNIKNKSGSIYINTLKLTANKSYNLSAQSKIKLNASKLSESAMDNSLPIIQFEDNAYEVTEGNSGSTKLLLNLTREGNLDKDSTVKYIVDFSNSDAIKSDFSGKTEGTVTFKAGQASKTITLNIKGDKLVEGDESFDVVLSAVKNAELGEISSVTPMILDNDIEIIDTTETPTPIDNTPKEIISTLNVSQSASQTEEGDTISYRLDLDQANNQPIIVNYKIINKTTDNQDFDSNSTGNVTFDAGETSKIINIAIQDDTLFESDENFDFQVSSNSNILKFENSRLSNVILSNDQKNTSNTNTQNPTPTIQKSFINLDTINPQVFENAGQFAFNVSRNNSNQTNSIDYVINHINTDNSDFNGNTSGTIIFNPNETNKTIFIAINNDSKVESDEQFTFKLKSQDSNVEFKTDSTTATILNDDQKPIDKPIIVKSMISVIDNSIIQSENQNIMSFKLMREGSNEPITIDYKISHKNTDDFDFSGNLVGQITFGQNETLKSVDIYINNDSQVESDESFNINFSSNNPNVEFKSNFATGTITNDDAKPKSTIGFSNTNLSQSENAGSFNFTVTRSGSTDPVLVNYVLSNISTDANDFTGSTSGNISFAQGENSKTISIAVNNDSTYETDENFTVNLSSYDSNVTLSNSTATGTITNDDAKPKSTIGFSNTNLSQSENAGSFNFTVTRSGATDPVSINYALTYNTTDSNDFTGSTSGTVSFGQGETSKLLILNVNNDNNFEADENFTVNLSSYDSNVTLSNSTATGTITNDDAKPKSTVGFANSELKQLENAGSMTFYVNRVGSSDPISVNYQVIHDSTNDQDFNNLISNGTISFGQGETSKSLILNINNDSDFESDESFKVKLSSSSDSVVIKDENKQIEGKILNDDAKPKSTIGFSNTSLSQSENAGNFNFTVTRSGATDPVSINYALSNVSTDSNDFSGNTSGIVSFSQSETSKTITIQVNNDNDVESDENFTVNLSSSDSNATLSNFTATGTINNDDVVNQSQSSPLNFTQITKVEGFYRFSVDGQYVSYLSDAFMPPNFEPPKLFIKNLQNGETKLFSLPLDENNQYYWATNDLGDTSISNDGRYLAFQSSSSLLNNDTNNTEDVYWKDIKTGEIKLASTNVNGIQGNNSSFYPDISADGRYVTFMSNATNLVAEKNSYIRGADIFVKDMQTGDIKLASISADGNQANNGANSSSISGNGRYVIFMSTATNLVAGGSKSNVEDIFIRDMQIGITKLIATNNGLQGNGWSLEPKISNDGRYVVFQSDSSNLVPNDTNGNTDAFVTDIQSGQIVRVSIASDGSQGNSYSQTPNISPDGRYITFYSGSTNFSSDGVGGSFVTPNPLWQPVSMQKQQPLNLSLEIESTVGQPLGWNSTVNLNPNQFYLNNMTSSLLNTESILGNSDKNYLA